MPRHKYSILITGGYMALLMISPSITNKGIYLLIIIAKGILILTMQLAIIYIKGENIMKKIIVYALICQIAVILLAVSLQFMWKSLALTLIIIAVEETFVIGVFGSIIEINKAKCTAVGKEE